MNYGSFFKLKILHPEVKVGIVRYIVSFFGVLVIGSLLIVFQHEDPINAAKLIVNGAFGSLIAFGNTIRWATPCLFTGAAAIVAFKSGVTNLGIEGQMYVGALTAGILGYLVHLPPFLNVLLILICSGIAGMLWAVLPALMRLFFSINEYISTMMMNFIGTLLCDYIVVWIVIPSLHITTVTASTPTIPEAARLPNLVAGTSASIGFLIGIAVAIFVFILFKYTIQGYELRQVGENLKFAKNGGVNIKRTFISIFVLSGLLAGLCGGVEVTGGYYKFVSNFSFTMGWEGIMIANICNLNPIALIFVSIIWGALKTGAMSMERATSLNRLTVNLLQMLFVLLVSIDYEGIFNYFKEKREKAKDSKYYDKSKAMER